MKPYYSDGAVTIYHGDCLDILPEIRDVDLVVTSPPYDQLRDYGGNWSFDFDKTALKLKDCVVVGGVIVWVVGDQTTNGSESGTSFKQALGFMEVGLNLHDTMIYEKNNFSHPEVLRYHSVSEYMFVLSCGRPKCFNPICDKPNVTAGSTCLGVSTFMRPNGSRHVRATQKVVSKDFGMRGNVWRGKTAGQENICESLPHPAMMPYWLASDHIRSWSNPKDLVLDPFAGSGTTLLAAKNLNRKGIGIEIEERYCEIAARRMEQEVFAF